MKKNDLKYVINAALFVDVCAIAAIGLLMAAVIPEGRAPGASKYFLGLHRHEWGDIHLYLSLLLCVLLILHILNNWTWITQCTKRYFGDRWSQALWGLSGAWVVILAIAWLIALF